MCAGRMRLGAARTPIAVPSSKPMTTSVRSVGKPLRWKTSLIRAVLSISSSSAVPQEYPQLSSPVLTGPSASWAPGLRRVVSVRRRRAPVVGAGGGFELGVHRGRGSRNLGHRGWIVAVSLESGRNRRENDKIERIWRVRECELAAGALVGCPALGAEHG